MVLNADNDAALWRDPEVPAEDRVADLIGRMTLEEKVAQLYGVWVGIDVTEGEVAPHQHEMAAAPADWDELIRSGLGQLTRPFGTAPVDPLLGAKGLAESQRQIMAAGRFGIAIRGARAPCMLKVASPEGELVSVSAATGTVNITPLTHLLSARLLGSGAPAGVFAAAGAVTAVAGALPAAAATTTIVGTVTTGAVSGQPVTTRGASATPSSGRRRARRRGTTS